MTSIDGGMAGFVGYKDKKKGLAPLTDSVPLADGRRTFQVDVAGRDSLVLYGVVTLNLPDRRYQKTETTLPVYVTLLKGTPITGSIVTRRALTGPAPYKAALSLALDRPSQQALGEVHWQVSRDSGATWQALSERLDQTAVNTTFDVGRYQLRARLLNKNTGAEGFSETVAIHVYDVPKLAVVGTRTAFTGAPIQLTAQLRVRDQPVAGVVEWWLAKEKQKVADGLTYSFAKDKPTAVPLEVRARLESAPADDPAAWGLPATRWMSRSQRRPASRSAVPLTSRWAPLTGSRRLCSCPRRGCCRPSIRCEANGSCRMAAP